MVGEDEGEEAFRPTVVIVGLILMLVSCLSVWNGRKIVGLDWVKGRTTVVESEGRLRGETEEEVVEGKGKGAVGSLLVPSSRCFFFKARDFLRLMVSLFACLFGCVGGRV